MRTLSRNKKKFYYCLFLDDMMRIDSEGNETSEHILFYDTEVAMTANISPATGQSNTEQFGNLENYDKVIVTDDMSCPIDEHSVLFIDKEPEWGTVETYLKTIPGYLPTSIPVPIPDYTVLRVAKSINSISIAVKKVTVS